MESDTNPFPEFKLFNPIERIRKIGRFFFGSEVHNYMSNHYHRDQQATEQWEALVTADLEKVERWTRMATPEEMDDLNRWDDQGTYLDNSGEF